LSSRDKPLLPLVHGAITVPMPGETQCGDDWVMFPSGGGQALLVVDGLGHGAEAAVAARAAIASAVQSGHLGAEGIIDAVHRALRPTRGAAAAVAVLESDKQMCTFCGIGNIAAIIRVAGKSRSMVSHNGILGHQVRKIESFDYPFPRGALCVAHSDGLATRWDLDTYPGLEARHPSILAAVLFRDNSRGRDDSTVVAVRAGASP
jgi:serine phosphatase RsbU (regulator of sigma subunit)